MCAGVMQTTLDSETKRALVVPAFSKEHDSERALTKFKPDIMTVVPPAAGPKVGCMEVKSSGLVNWNDV